MMKGKKWGLALCACLLLPFTLPAQAHLQAAAQDSTIKHPADTAVRQKDLLDVIGSLFKVEPRPPQPKRADVPYISVLPAVGYTLQNGFTAVLSFNVSFYTDTVKNANLSAITFNGNFTQKDQYFFPLISNIWTRGNKLEFSGDWRYYIYPSLTYGLGSRSKLEDADQIDYEYMRVYQSVMKQLLPDLMGGVGYGLDYHWKIQDSKKILTEYAHETGSQTSDESVSSGLSATLLYDTRRNPNNPRPGYYCNITYRHNLQFLGSDENWQSVLLDLRKYIRLPSRSKNTLALWSYDWLTFGGNVPYLDLPSTGWDTYANLGRGYIQSRLRGKDLLYAEMEYRYHITRNGLFGGVVFVNAQSVPEWPGNHFDMVYPGAGLGIRIKMNKFSDSNVGVDYGVGLGGSHGFFFNLGEVF